MSRLKMTLAASATMALALAMNGAQAADLPSRAMAPIPPAFTAYNWTGFYVGAQVGYKWGSDRTTEFVTATGLASGFDRGFSPKGVIGGLHAGYNQQFGAMVVGVEADIEASGYRGGYTNVAPTGTRFRSDWQGSVRARLGVTPVDRMLVYVTGGVAFAQIRHSYFNGAISEGFTQTRTGYTIGAGVEYAFTNNLTARVEYRYSDYGRFRNASLVAFPGFTYRHDPSDHVVRVGVSYKF